MERITRPVATAMLPVAETGDGLPRAGSVQIASRRFSQNSLYRQPLRLSAPHGLEKTLQPSFGNVGKKSSSAGSDVIAVGRILSGGHQDLLPEKSRPEAGLRTVIVGGRRSEGGLGSIRIADAGRRQRGTW